MRTKNIFFTITLLALNFLAPVDTAPVDSITISDSCKYFFCPSSPQLPPRE